MATKTEIKKALAKKTGRSAWQKGVIKYAKELINSESVDSRKDYTRAELKKALLNGARDWKQYSWGGSSLVYNEDIAKRLSSPSELKKTDNGRKKPNAREDWLDVQTRALHQACELILSLA